MNLEDLFVSHKQVEPIEFNKSTLELPKPIYVNADRAQRVVSSTDEESSDSETETDMSSWRVAGYNPTSRVATSGNSEASQSWTSIYGANDKNKWIADMTAAYKRAGITDNAIKYLIAKNALESGWGRYAQGDYNFGNITTGSNWTGRYVQGKDKDSNGNPIGQKFRAYDNLDAFVTDEINFLTRLYNFNKDDDFETFIGKLQGNNSGKRKYAAATDYADRIRRVYNSI